MTLFRRGVFSQPLRQVEYRSQHMFFINFSWDLLFLEMIHSLARFLSYWLAIEELSSKYWVTKSFLIFFLLNIPVYCLRLVASYLLHMTGQPVSSDHGDTNFQHFKIFDIFSGHWVFLNTGKCQLTVTVLLILSGWPIIDISPADDRTYFC